MFKPDEVNDRGDRKALIFGAEQEGNRGIEFSEELRIVEPKKEIVLAKPSERQELVCSEKIAAGQIPEDPGKKPGTTKFDKLQDPIPLPSGITVLYKVVFPDDIRSIAERIIPPHQELGEHLVAIRGVADVEEGGTHGINGLLSFPDLLSRASPSTGDLRVKFKLRPNGLGEV